MFLGQWYHALKDLALGKYHTKFQLSSPKGMKVIRCKRNADVKLHLNAGKLIVLLLLQICFFFVMNFMTSLSRANQADIIEAFNSTSRYLDDLLYIDNIYFDQMVDRIYPTELQLNRTNSSDTEALFWI